MSMEMDFLRRSARCSRLEKIRNNVNIKKICFRLHKIQTVELVWPRGKDGSGKTTSKNVGMVSAWKKKKGKTSKFVDAGGYNRNGRGGN